jgi:RNA polymerase sigma-70 factor (ECF subfamily)
MPFTWLPSLLLSMVGGALGDDSVTPEDYMARYQAGEQAAFEQLYRSQGPRLFGYLLRMTRSRAAAEDLVQITFTKVHRASASFLPGEKVLPWLFAIARRSFLDERRRMIARREELSRDGTLPDTKGTSDQSRDLAAQLEFAMTKIPESYAEAIQLTKISGLSVREAASIVGTTEAAVKLRVHRGYVLLRKILERLEGDAA